MPNFFNILYAAFLFCIFLLLILLPVALVAWCIRRWYATHRLARLPWRRRRALRGLALLCTAAFSRLARWKKITGIAVILSLLLVVFLSWLNAALYCDTPEALIAGDLSRARYQWLDENCPRPIDSQRYLGVGTFSNYVYTAAVVVNSGTLKDRKWQGLFAVKDAFSPRTYVIATTGEVFVLDGSGGVRLLRAQ
jgi:hypothetical protein